MLMQLGYVMLLPEVVSFKIEFNLLIFNLYFNVSVYRIHYHAAGGWIFLSQMGVKYIL